MIKISDLSVKCISHPSFESNVFDDFLNTSSLQWVRKGQATEAELLVCLLYTSPSPRDS